MKTQNGSTEMKPYERGFHPLYLWGIVYVLLTYSYLPLSYLSPLFLAAPLLLLAVNIWIAIQNRNRLDGRYFLNTALIIKYALIPFYLIGGALILVCALLTFTPVVIMIFVGPMMVAMLSVMGWLSLAGSAPVTIAYLCHSVKTGKNGRGFAALIGIMQFFFGLDVLGVVIATVKERKNIKVTIGVFLGLFLIGLGLAVWMATHSPDRRGARRISMKFL